MKPILNANKYVFTRKMNCHDILEINALIREIATLEEDLQHLSVNSTHFVGHNPLGKGFAGEQEHFTDDAWEEIRQKHNQEIYNEFLHVVKEKLKELHTELLEKYNVEYVSLPKEDLKKLQLQPQYKQGPILASHSVFSTSTITA